jgi:hypothetical protein
MKVKLFSFTFFLVIACQKPDEFKITNSNELWFSDTHIYFGDSVLFELKKSEIENHFVLGEMNFTRINDSVVCHSRYYQSYSKHYTFYNNYKVIGHFVFFASGTKLDSITYGALYTPTEKLNYEKLNGFNDTLELPRNNYLMDDSVIIYLYQILEKLDLTKPYFTIDTQQKLEFIRSASRLPSYFEGRDVSLFDETEQ